MSGPAATFTLSLDVEMAWGSWRQGRWPWDAFAAEPAIVRRLDALAGSLRMPFTFGVVGALATRCVDRMRGLDASAGVDTAFPELAGGYPPGSLPTVGLVLARPQSWFDGSVTAVLRNSPAGHEVCSHTFFHSLPRSPELLPLDMAASRAAIGEVSALIFPRDAVGFVAALPGAGITVYRGTGESAYLRARGEPRHLGRLAHLVDQGTGRRAPLARALPGPTTCLTTSAFLTMRTGPRRRIPVAVLRRRFVGPLREAVARQGVYHLWTHPWNLALPGSDGLDLLSEVLVAAADLRDRGDLTVRTMSQLAALANGDRTTG